MSDCLPHLIVAMRHPAWLTSDNLEEPQHWTISRQLSHPPTNGILTTFVRFLPLHSAKQ